MAITFVASTLSAYGSVTNIVGVAPAGIANGDWLLASISMGAAEAPDVTPPAGWSEWATMVEVLDGGWNIELRVFAKKAASESGNYTFTHANGFGQIWIGCFRGVDPTTPQDVAGTSNTGTGGTNRTWTGLTTVTPGAMLVAFGTDWNNTALNLTPPSGMTERADAPITYVATETISSAGATGNRSHLSNANPYPWLARLVALRPVVSSHALTPNSIATGAATVGAPVLGQKHAVVANGIAAAAPTTGAPALAQRHVIAPTGIATGVPTVGSPLAGHRHVLAPVGIAAAAPVLGSPALGQKHALAPTGLATAAPTVGTPAATHIHGLAPNPVTTGAPVVGTPALAQRHILAPTGITATPTVGQPGISGPGTVALETLGVATAAPTVGAPALTQRHAFVPAGIAAAPVVGAPALGQAHALAPTGVSSGAPTLGAPALSGPGTHALTLVGIATTPLLAAPALGQVHALGPVGIETGAPVLGAPSLAGPGLSVLTLVGIATGAPTVGAPGLDAVVVALRQPSRRVISPAAASLGARDASLSTGDRASAQSTARRPRAG